MERTIGTDCAVQCWESEGAMAQANGSSSESVGEGLVLAG